LVENKNKVPTGTFGVDNKNLSQNFVTAFEKISFFCLDPDADWKKIPESGSVKKNPDPKHWLCTSNYLLFSW
jgi:hypothetical protein